MVWGQPTNPWSDASVLWFSARLRSSALPWAKQQVCSYGQEPTASHVLRVGSGHMAASKHLPQNKNFPFTYIPVLCALIPFVDTHVHGGGSSFVVIVIRALLNNPSGGPTERLKNLGRREKNDPPPQLRVPGLELGRTRGRTGCQKRNQTCKEKPIMGSKFGLGSLMLTRLAHFCILFCTK